MVSGRKPILKEFSPHLCSGCHPKRKTTNTCPMSSTLQESTSQHVKSCPKLKLDKRVEFDKYKVSQPGTGLKRILDIYLWQLFLNPGRFWKAWALGMRCTGKPGRFSSVHRRASLRTLDGPSRELRILSHCWETWRLESSESQSDSSVIKGIRTQVQTPAPQGHWIWPGMVLEVPDNQWV